ncbi:hypothetical protein [Pseudonocardia nigra]|uniref:hypothetical protein n=1 Tax=Pseudonocardia nigra TaxID=1921578 RepID=UPI001C5F50B4|nr:hypothetical protein [Pseudonocardia nigra]
MRNAVPRVALALAVALAAAGCTATVAGRAAPDPAALSTPPSPTAVPLPPREGEFTDAQGRFALVPPAGWVADTSGVQNTAVLFVDPQPFHATAGPFSANINVLVQERATDLQATVAGVRRELADVPGYGSTADESVVLADGTPAHLFGGTFRHPEIGFELRNLQLFTVHDGATVIITGTAPVEAWADYEAAIDTSLRTLTVAA